LTFFWSHQIRTVFQHFHISTVYFTIDNSNDSVEVKRLIKRNCFSETVSLPYKHGFQTTRDDQSPFTYATYFQYGNRNSKPWSYI